MTVQLPFDVHMIFRVMFGEGFLFPSSTFCLLVSRHFFSYLVPLFQPPPKTECEEKKWDSEVGM